MRSRKDIEEEVDGESLEFRRKVIIELLLDNRDLLIKLEQGKGFRVW